MTPPLNLPAVDFLAALVAGWAAYGIEVTASYAPPLVCGCWEVTCPDGGRCWLTPTAAQVAEWDRSEAAR